MNNNVEMVPAVVVVAVAVAALAVVVVLQSGPFHTASDLIKLKDTMCQVQ